MVPGPTALFGLHLFTYSSERQNTKTPRRDDSVMSVDVAVHPGKESTKSKLRTESKRAQSSRGSFNQSGSRRRDKLAMTPWYRRRKIFRFERSSTTNGRPLLSKKSMDVRLLHPSVSNSYWPAYKKNPTQHRTEGASTVETAHTKDQCGKATVSGILVIDRRDDGTRCYTQQTGNAFSCVPIIAFLPYISG